MARIQYGPDAAPIELQLVRVNSLMMTPEQDDSGTDYTMTRVELDVSFQWHPWATASNVGGAAAPPFDPIGVSARALRTVLSYPRQTFRLAIGNQVVWEVPMIGPGGVRLPCDPGNGPVPGPLYLTEIEGEYGASGRWKITFWVMDEALEKQIVLSNRWTTTAETNDAGFTVRTIEGSCVIRADAIDPARQRLFHASVYSAGDFRRWMFCPCPLGFRRSKVRVKVNEAGTRAYYVCQDVEDPNPLGATGAGIQATKFSGEATAGTVAAWRSWGNPIYVAAGDPSPGEKTPTSIHSDAAALVGLELVGMLPKNVATGHVTVTGGKTAKKRDLMTLAIRILQDRFFDATIVSASATQGLGESEQKGRWVRVSMAFLPNLSTFIATAFNSLDFSKQMNLANDIIARNADGSAGPKPNVAPALTFPGDVPPPDGDPAAFRSYSNWNLPAGVRPGDASGSRGSWVGALITQALSTQGEPADVPPANDKANYPNLV